MFDIGWQELFLIALITILVVGPKELPGVLRTVTHWIRKVRTMAREFQDGMEDLARESELHELRREVEDAATGDIEDHLEKTIDPTGEMGEAVREIGGTVEEEGAVAADALAEPGSASNSEPDKAREADAPAADKKASGAG